MSNRPAIIALLVTILLAAGAFLVLRSPSGPTAGPSATLIAQGEPLLLLDPVAVRTVTLDNPPLARQTLERRPDGAWSWAASPASATRYTLDDSNVRAFLRAFADAKGQTTPTPGATLPDQPPPVVLTFTSDTDEFTIRLAPRSLGGQVLADVRKGGSPPRAAVVGETLLKLLTHPGPSAWRDTRAVPLDPAQAAQITFTDGTRTKGFGLSRREGRYLVAPPAPVTAPASNESVAAVIRALAGLVITRFFDDGAGLTPAATGLDKPSAILTLTFEDRSVDAAGQQAPVATRTFTLTFGLPADTGGTTLYATPDGGQTIFAVAAEPLAGLTGPPANLIARNPSRTLPADVGALELASLDRSRTARLVRDATTGRWTESVNGAPPVTQSAEEAGASNVLLDTLTVTQADAVLLQQPSKAVLIGTAALYSPGGQPLDRFDIYAGDKGEAVLAQQGVFRVVTRPPAGLQAWMQSVAPRR
ncbi:MAG: DUF4340 domain-containing protein [Phycisphaerales bacterium]|nr:DUF4340 domain-containing protein [Phycisphaerales bacterium]